VDEFAANLEQMKQNLTNLAQNMGFIKLKVENLEGFSSRDMETGGIVRFISN